MGMTATELGREFGRTAREMNTLLRNHGFLEGGPGAWRPTELGKAFAQWHDFDNGYTGSYARAWEWLSWTDGVADALKASMAVNPLGVIAPAPAPAAVVKNLTSGALASRTGSRGGGQLLNRKGWVAVAVLGGLAASTPAARRAWHETVKPTASNIQARISERKSARSGDVNSQDDPAE